MADSDYRPTDRRPIASRDWTVSRHCAEWLTRRRVSPNAISIFGMFAACAAGGCLAATALVAAPWDRACWLAAAILIPVRLLANLFDGMVAVAGGTASPVGELYNDVPDRISDAAVLVGAGYASGGDVALGFGAACVALFTAYVRNVGKAAGAKHEYCGPMAKQQRMAVVAGVAVYLALAPESWQPIWNRPPTAGLIAAGLCVIILGGIVTAARRLGRIANQLRNRS